MKAVEDLRAAGAVVVIDDTLLPAAFQQAIGKVNTRPYRLQGTTEFLKNYGPAQYHSPAEYEKAVGSPLPPTITGLPRADTKTPAPPNAPPPVQQVNLTSDPKANANFFEPQRQALAIYNEALQHFHLDGFVYPAAQMPPPDETMPQNGQLSSGPHSATGWVNRIGVPAVVVPGGFYPTGLPFRSGTIGGPMERWRLARLGLCLRASNEASQAAGSCRERPLTARKPLESCEAIGGS